GHAEALAEAASRVMTLSKLSKPSSSPPRNGFAVVAGGGRFFSGSRRVDGPARTMGKPNRKRHFRAIAQAILQALVFKHLKPTSPLREARSRTGSPEAVRDICR
ncbi:hypothetical protein, partial [Bradyrhizobium ivorense]|uniref:hypothetical protein n=1 Tax=Bradyrhizobium ivorense TaxID=2511166 RepID=UPI001E36D56A